MKVWTTAWGVARFGIEVSRDVLRFSERLSPWPLSLVPRTLRLPLDGIIGLAGTLVAEPEPVPDRDERAAPVRGRARAEKRRSDQQRMAPEEHRTATIAGARSDGAADAPLYDREFRARNAPLYVRDAGAGPAIVLLHAFPLGSRMWEPQLDGLADRFRVLAPDLAGFGLSWVPTATGYSLADQAEAIDHTLEDLRIDELLLVGLSMGGYVAFPLLERLGARVRGLVLASTRAEADAAKAVDDRHRLAAEVERDGVEVAADELVPRLLGASTQRDRPDLVDRVHAMVLENKASGVASALRAMAARPDSTPALERIACPVLVITGEEDTLLSTPSARIMAGRIPDARVEVLRGGHLPNLEATQDFNRLVEEIAQQAFAAERPRRRARAARA